MTLVAGLELLGRVPALGPTAARQGLQGLGCVMFIGLGLKLALTDNPPS